MSDDANGQHDGESGNDGQQLDQQREASTVEKAVIVVSIAFTLLLFAYAGWQIATPPGVQEPQVSVVGTETTSDGSVAVTVRLRNPSDVGLVSATVESNCTSPPPDVRFSYVPALSDRTGTLVCPSGTTDPSVSVANWVRR